MATKLSDIFEKMARTVKACSSLSLWKEIVDERISNNTDAIKISNQTLFVSTSTPVWAQELSYLKKEMIIKFNERAGEEIIRDIRFKST